MFFRIGASRDVKSLTQAVERRFVADLGQRPDGRFLDAFIFVGKQVAGACGTAFLLRRRPSASAAVLRTWPFSSASSRSSASPASRYPIAPSTRATVRRTSAFSS